MSARRWRQLACSAAVSLGALAMLLLPALPAGGGQAGNPAGISGVITDSSGAVLPGVTVTATSPALQIPSVTSVSDERGEYRLSPLPIGVYSVLFELSGFQKLQREGVRLTVGFTARVDEQLNVGALAETVTVSGASPLVDTTSTATSTELTRKQLEVLPTSRDGFHAFLNQTPGVRTNLDVGSSGLGDTVIFRFYGQEGSSWQMLEGVVSSAPTASGTQDSHVDFNAIEGSRVQTVGSNAEMPRRGLLVDSVVKSGGNEFHGGIVLYGSGSQLESNNIDAGLAAAGIRDIPDAFDPDGTLIANVKEGTYHFEKISYQMTPGSRFAGFYHVNNDMELRNASRFIPRERMLDKDNPVLIAKAEWQIVRGNSLVTSLQYGQWDFNGNNRGISPGKQSTRDIATRAWTSTTRSTRTRLVRGICSLAPTIYVRA